MHTHTANLIWNTLVQICGANENGRRDWLLFIAAQKFTEYRFGGALGSGGKVWNRGEKTDHYHVDCYPEDRTAERDAMIAAANEQLKGIP